MGGGEKNRYTATKLQKHGAFSCFYLLHEPLQTDTGAATTAGKREHGDIGEELSNEVAAGISKGIFFH